MKGMNHLTIRCAQIISMIGVLDGGEELIGGDSEGRAALCDSMSLDEDNLNELFVTASRMADKYVEGFDDAGLARMLAHYDDNWQNNNIQMPRLLSEIMATVEGVDLDAVNKALHISRTDLCALIDEADKVWQDAKDGIAPTHSGRVAVAVVHIPGDDDNGVYLIDVSEGDTRADIIDKAAGLAYEDGVKSDEDRAEIEKTFGHAVKVDSLFVFDGRLADELLTPH